jgi:AcrR family transcriptional regulator
MASRSKREVPTNQRSASLRAREESSKVGQILDFDQPFTPRETELLRSTYRLMARVGTQELSLRQVGADAGVSPPLLVYYFGNKEGLMRQTMHWALASMVHRIERHIGGTRTSEEALEALIDAIFVSPKANRDFYLVYLDLVQHTVRNSAFEELAELLRTHINGSYAFVIRHGIEEGVFEVDDVDSAASRARAIVEGGLLQWLQDSNWRETHAELRKFCHSALLEMLQGSRN